MIGILSGRYDDDFEEYEHDTNSPQGELETELGTQGDDDILKLSSSSAGKGVEDVSTLMESDSVFRKKIVSRINVYTLFY